MEIYIFAMFRNSQPLAHQRLGGGATPIVMSVSQSGLNRWVKGRDAGTERAPQDVP